MLEGLNIPQLTAVTSPARSILVLAGAGSGKTGVLTRRIAFLIKEKGVSPHNILALTFTRKAAEEMKQRLSLILDPKDVRSLWIGTFHAISLRILEQYGSKLGYQKYLGVYDEMDQQDIIGSIIAEFNLKLKPGEVLSELNRFAADCDNTQFEGEIATVIQQYRNRLKQYNALDFSSLLTETLRLLRTHKDVYTFYHEKFKHVFIDEYQDVDRTQYYLHEALQPENIFAVGDDNQAIYKFRGADMQIVLDFEKSHADAQVIKLEQSYRCPEDIITLANNLIGNNPQQYDKVLWTEKPGGIFNVKEFPFEDDEASWIRHKIGEIVLRDGKFEFKDIAVLTRSHAQYEKIVEELERGLIPYKAIGKGYNFWKSTEARFLVSILQVLHNKRNSFHFARIAQHILYPMSEADWIEYEIKALKAQASIYELLIKERYGPMGELSEWYNDNRFAPLSEVASNTLKLVNIVKYFQDQGLNLRAANLENIQDNIAEWEESSPDDTTVGTFLAWLASQDVQSDVDDSDKVKVGTVHAVKGLEFPVVFLAQMNEEQFPHKRSIKEGEVEEERRLCYVAITRPKERLYVTRCTTEERKGMAVATTPSRFIEEMKTSQSQTV